MEPGDTFVLKVDCKVVITDYDTFYDGQTGIVLGFFPDEDDDEDGEEFEVEDYGAIILLDEPSVERGVRAILVPVTCLGPFVTN